MAKSGNYGWTPEQMARVNARRERRGQQALSDVKMEDDDYSKAYNQEAERYAGRNTQPQGAPEKRPSSLDQYAESQKQFRERFNQPRMSDRMAESTKQFRERFNKPSLETSIQAKNIAERVEDISEEEKKKRNRNKISTPISDSYSRFVA